MKIKIDYDKCCWKNNKCESCDCKSNSNGSCEGCAEICPVQAIERKRIVEVDFDKCISCGACISACSKDAISFDG